MEYETQAQIAIFKLISWFVALFVLLAHWLFPQPATMGKGERFFANLARTVMTTVMIVQGLVLLHLFDFFSLVASYLVLWLGIASLRRRRLPLMELDQAISFLETMIIDVLEGNLPYRVRLTNLWRRVQRRMLSWQPDREVVAWGAVLGMVLLISAGLRLAGVTSRAAPGDPGAYLHITWTRLLASNMIWRDGAYPMGAHSWVQMIAQFARVDEALLVRTAGGLVGLLLTLAVYVAVRWAGGRRGAAVAATALYGMFIYAGVLPAEAWRQQELRPFEFGLVFLLPALMFFADFLDAHRRPALLLAGECLAAAFVLHPVSGLFGLIGLLAVLLLRAISGRGAGRLIGWAIGAAGAAALLGNLFLLLARVLGRPRHRGVLDIVAAFFTPGRPDPAWQLLTWGLALLGAGLLLAPPLRQDFGELSRAAQGTAHRRVLFGRSVGLFLWLLLALFVGYPALLSPDKVGIPLSLVAAVALGLELDIVVTLARRLVDRLGGLCLQPSVGLIAGLVALAIAGMTVISPPLQANPGPAQEPESLARALYRIKTEHQAYTWTVIGYQEALSQVLGRGYFLPWKAFLEQYDPMEYRFDPRAPKLAVPTRYVFIMVEKQIFVGPDDLAADTLERASLQVELQEWVARYQKYHDDVSGDLSVYYEDSSVAVYQIYRSSELERQIIEEYEAELFGP